MFERMRRLHPRGPAARGVVVDADGATLGPDCALVRRTAQGYRLLAREEAAVLQDFLFGESGEPDWLFRQCQRIAAALDNDQIALAQIFGLRIPIDDLDDWRLNRLAAAAPLIKAGFNPDEPRVPAGEPGGGEWTTDGDSEMELPDSPEGGVDGGQPSVAPGGGAPAEAGDDGDWIVPAGGSAAADSHAETGGGGAPDQLLPAAPVQNDNFDPGAIIPIADFSGGFHDTVVKEWLDAWQKAGIPAIASPAIRIIGPDGQVQGYPDVLIHEPGQPVEAYEVKTGANPTFTSQQMRYIPMLQVGGHVYSTDPRITDLGLTSGVPFPPMRVGIIYTPGPGQRYVVRFLPDPFYVPGP
jgi:hypothetical protein